MKTMKSFKCLVAMFIMAMAFAVTGLTAQAAETTIANGQTVTGTQRGYTWYKYVVPANGYMHVTVDSDGQYGADFDILASNKSTRIASLDANDSYYDDVYHAVAKGQVFYIKTYQYSSSTYHKINIRMRSGNITYGDKEFYQKTSQGYKWIGKFTNATLKNGVYVGIRANQTGIMSVNTTSDRSFYTALCNYRKYPVTYGFYTGNYSSGTYYDTIGYGVARGYTYYLKFYSDSSYAGTKTIVFNAAIKAAYAPATTMQRAVNLPYNRVVTTAFLAGTKNVSWYKFQLNAPRAINIYTMAQFYGNSRDSYYITIYRYGSRNPLKQVACSGYTYTNIKGNNLVSNSRRQGLTTRGSKLGRGTYYILISTNSFRANGAVAVQWR